MGQAWVTVRNWIKRRKVSSFGNTTILLLLLLLMLLITGMQLNQLSMYRLLDQIEQQGINYDEFREMKLSENNFRRARDRISKLLMKYPVLKEVKGVNLVGYLTFSMLSRGFDLEEESLVDEYIFIKCLPKLVASPDYQRLYGYYNSILNNNKYFPVPRIEGDAEDIFFCDSWNELRRYGGKRRHEGTDIMAKNDIRGFYPIISITDGVIEKKGWLEQGGYRIGVRSPSGGYFYYAHLFAYAEGIQEGDRVIAGQLLGFMGDSGYGEEGTVGQFDVHLHLGIYVRTEAGELSINPFRILKLLEKNRINYPGLYE